MTKMLPIMICFSEENPASKLKEKVDSQQAKDVMTLADMLSDMILFHSRVRRNGTIMMQP